MVALDESGHAPGNSAPEAAEQQKPTFKQSPEYPKGLSKWQPGLFAMMKQLFTQTLV
jgi:hypothetical protein